MRSRTGCRRLMPNSGSPKLSMRPVELRMSANRIVRRLRSPPLACSDLSTCCQDWLDISAAIGFRAALHCPQKRAVGPLRWPQALHSVPSVAPHPSQYSLVALFWQPQRKHCIDGPLDRIGNVTASVKTIMLYTDQFYAALQ